MVEQVYVDGEILRGSGAQGHELAALPDMLTLLDLSEEALVSLDTLGYQPEVAAQIMARGGDYLMAFRQN